jgi:hypothetical protein
MGMGMEMQCLNLKPNPMHTKLTTQH